MSPSYQANNSRHLKPKPTAWCCVRALAVLGAGAAFWVATVAIFVN
jgi:hypothetical protein